MTEKPATIVEPAPVFDLDLERLGAALRLIPVISARVGHNSTRSTLGYGVPVTPEAQFIHDVFSLKTEEVIEKWYGGYENAGRLGVAAAEDMAALVETRRKRPRPATGATE